MPILALNADLDDALLCSPAERELLAELDADARCTCRGQDQPPVHDFPPCAAQLIKYRHAEIVSLQVLTDANAQPDPRQDGDSARQHAQRLLREYLRAAFIGAGLAWRNAHETGIGVLVYCLIQAVHEDTEPRGQ